MQQYWENVRTLYGEDRVQKYLDFNNSMDDDKPLEGYTDKHELLADMITSLLFDAFQEGHLSDDSDSLWKVDLGRYQYLVDLYGYPSSGSQMITNNTLITEKVKEIEEEDLFGLFAVTIMMHLKIIDEMEAKE